jgi:UPF0755 protein
MKRLVILILPLFALILLALGSFVWWQENSGPVSGDTTLQDFLIVKGSSAEDIGSGLKKAGLIKNSLAFKWYLQVAGKQTKVQTGEYRLSPSFSLTRLVAELMKGPTEVWVTVPEGLRKEEIAQRFVQGLSVKNSEVFVANFLEASKVKEGFLFPDTYLFPKDVTGTAVANKLISTFDKKVEATMKADIQKGGYSLNQVITMASILERETKTDTERPVVAGILYRRVKAGWPLQADATVQYAIANTKCQITAAKCDNWWTPLIKDDLEIKSPYNTYKYPGLPPAPIANPGLSSIRAAIYPQDSPYWFYLHDSEEQIHYAETIEEHNANIRKYLGK